MATELHHPEDRKDRVASVPEAPGICHVMSLHMELNMLHITRIYMLSWWSVSVMILVEPSVSK
jgi:hypothetical protein